MEGCGMTTEEQRIFDRGYNEGFFVAAQMVASEIIRQLGEVSDGYISERHKEAFKLRIEGETKRILQKRGLVPHSYDVMMGKAADVQLDFDMKV